MTDTYSITYTARGTTYNLNGYDADHGLTLNYLGDQGFGLAPLHRITTRGPLQHGDSDIDFRLDPRILQIPLVVKNESASPMYNSYVIREALLNIFRPQDGGVISVVRSDGVTTYTRSIPVTVLGGLTFDVDPQDYHVRTVVQLRADNPLWANPVENVVTVSSAQFGAAQTIVNNGNFLAYPRFEITGPITSFTVNPATGLSFSAGNIPISSTYYMDFAYNRKTYRTATGFSGTNLLGLINNINNFASLSLPAGSSGIVFTGTGLTADSKVVIKWFDRYTGI